MPETKHDYAAEVKKFVPSPDEEAVSGIVRHLGIALRSRDSSFVAAGDPEEKKRVREGFLKKKLALTQSDPDLDQAIDSVLGKMKSVRDKGRVTVCYLLAEHFGKLDLFHAKKKSTAA